MKLGAFVIVALFVGAIFAGCATPSAQAKSLTLNRQVRLHYDNQNADMLDSDPYAFISSSFVVRVGDSPLSAAAATISFTDKAGVVVSRPLSDFTSVATLAPGAEVVIPETNLTSDAVLSLDGVVLASRARAAQDWWVAGGYPIGFRMEPGALLSYTATVKGHEAMTLRDIESIDAEAPYRLDKLDASLGVEFAGTFDVSLASATENIQATSAHDARALAWKTKGTLSMPMLLDVAATNTSSGNKLEGGVQVLPNTGGSLDVSGKLWWNASQAPVRSDNDAGTVTTNADVISWLTGEDELVSEFSCAGKARGDGCRPSEFELEEANTTETIDASSTNLDNLPWSIQADVFSNLTRALSEDLVPGDELRFDIDVDRDHLGDTDSSDLPNPFSFKASAVLRAVQDERVTVAAGEFDAIKVVEQFDFSIVSGELRDSEGKLRMRAFTIDQRVIDTTFWLAKDTFVPLRVQTSSPFDLNKVVDNLINALPDETWAEASIKPITGDNVDFTVEVTSTLELASMTGKTSLSPWVSLMGFHAVGSLPFAIAGFAVPFSGRTSYDESPKAVEAPPASLSLASAGPIVANHKDYSVISTSEMSYFDIEWTLDGESLYESADAPGWCIVVDDACDDGASFASVAEGDVIRVTADDLAGRTLRVLDYRTNTVILALVVG